MMSPDTTGDAVAALKACISDPVRRVEVFDLLMNESVAVASATHPAVMPVDVDALTLDGYIERLGEIVRATLTLNEMAATTAFFADREDHSRVLKGVVERLAHREPDGHQKVVLVHLLGLPRMLVAYAIGLGATADGNFQPLARVLADVRVVSSYKEISLVEALEPYSVLDGGLLNDHAGQKRFTPASEWLHGVLRASVRGLYLDDERYDAVFDDLEYLLGLVTMDATRRYGTIGRFGWRRRYSERGARDGVVHRAASALLEAGLFGGDAEQLAATHAKFEAYIDDSTHGWR